MEYPTPHTPASRGKMGRLWGGPDRSRVIVGSRSRPHGAASTPAARTHPWKGEEISGSIQREGAGDRGGSMTVAREPTTRSRAR